MSELKVMEAELKVSVSAVNMILEIDGREEWPVMPVQKHGRDGKNPEEEKAARRAKVDGIGDEHMDDANPVSLPAVQGRPQVVVTTEQAEKTKKNRRKREDLLPPIALGMAPYSAVADIGNKMITMSVAQLCAVKLFCRRELANALSVREKKSKDPAKKRVAVKTIGIVNTVKRTRSQPMLAANVNGCLIMVVSLMAGHQRTC